MTILGSIICIILVVLNILVVSFAIDLLIDLVIKIVKLKKENRSATIEILCSIFVICYIVFCIYNGYNLVVSFINMVKG